VSVPTFLRARGLPHVIAIAALGVLGALIVWPAFGFPPSIPPFGPDNVYALHLGAYSDPASFFNDAEQVWRPVTYSTLWAQYQISGLDVSAFFGANIVLWIVGASLVYVVVYVHTHLALAAAAAAFITLTDARTFSPLILIIERQTTLACIFGLLAMLIAYRGSRAQRPNRAWLVATFVLLFLAAMSKEFGLAFAFGVAAIGLFGRQRELLVAGLGTFIAYWVVRGLIGGLHFGSGVAGSGGSGGESSDTGLCETMGFGANPREVCYGDLTILGQLAQYAWNVGASFVAILFYPVIHSNGYLLAPDVLGSTLGGPDYYEGFTLASLIVPCVVTGLAVVAWWTRPAITLPLLVIIVANAVLCFQYYRPRLIVVGMVALHVAAGIGIPPTVEILKKQLRRLTARAGSPPRPLGASGPALLVVILLFGTGAAVASRAVDLADALEGARGSHETRDPCDAVEVYDITEMPNRLKEKFGLPGRCQPQP
jgi:hypothetical protein